MGFGVLALLSLLNDGDLILLFGRMLRLRGLDTVGLPRLRVTVWFGMVRFVD